ncbi:hypothetical protein VP01_77g8 [Puccinia sorghi]|uniref:Tet-like 2OG-Fe(II) oxygenase domain-containing protein n=1 Tax=Puccinia sorghi TaxID=27349 RepID=A0A0L6UB62_9BASI|nr:hypothetical protein VP01_77g8 [Puccinia sorghi]
MPTTREAYLKHQSGENRQKRHQNDQNSEWSIRKYAKFELFPHTIKNSKHKPTQAQVARAYPIAKGFKYFEHGKFVILDGDKKDKIIAIIQFTPLENLTPKQAADLNIVTMFVHKCKKFVNSISSGSCCWGGKMCAFGWQKFMDAYKLAGIYLNEANIQAHKEEYKALMNSFSQPSGILGKMFQDMANVSFEQSCELMKTNSIPAFKYLHHQETLGQYDCSPHLKFTTNGFYNSPHCNNKDIQDFDFVVSLPTNISDSTLIKTSDRYTINCGGFVFPDYGFGIDFSEQIGIIQMVWAAKNVRHCTLPALESPSHTCMGMSLQINT